ncbi:MAG: YkgJ family cysteine cluster protein [Chlamydiia bacterium]|nr:YkgJ family cysteine cluster protein [Chlamydiia bacterium]MCB1116718.1 YkgJ family cysteine cluster protein [Chlamydiia bacterium]
MSKNSELLDDLLFEAAAAKKAPAPPQMGIPKQRVPYLIRQLLKWGALPFVVIDDAMQKIAKKIIRPPFKRVGKCKRRGNCCHYVLVAHSNKLIGKLFYFWYTQVLGFYKRLPNPQTYEGKKMHVMGCRHLRKDGSCGDYRLRPLICRQWPVIEHFGYPKVLKGCGFQSDPPYPVEEEDHLSDPRLKVLR